MFNAIDADSAPPDERQTLIAQSLHTGPRWRIYADALGLLTLFVLVVLGWFLSVPMHSAALKSAFACCVVLFIGAYLARRRVARNDRRSASRAVRAFWLAIVAGLGLALGFALLGPPFESGIPSVAEALPIAVGTITITSLLYDWLDPLGRGSVYLIAVAKRQSRRCSCSVNP